jgi:hypothetical protein
LPLNWILLQFRKTSKKHPLFPRLNDPYSSPETGEVIDFEFILVNPIFIKLFPADSELIKSGSSCVSFLQKKQLDWLPKLINLVTAGQPFSEIINLASQIIEVQGTKLGDGVSITLHPIVNHF